MRKILCIYTSGKGEKTKKKKKEKSDRDFKYN